MNRPATVEVPALEHLAMAHLAVGRDDRVLDVGCGAGWSSVELARRVGRRGTVVGVVVDAGHIEPARALAAANGLANVSFTTDPAGSAPFDVVHSSFGMTAFADARAALVAGGRVGFSCQGRRQEDEWASTVQSVVGRVVGISAADDDVGHAGTIHGALTAAGFGELRLRRVELTIRVGAGPTFDDALASLRAHGPLAAALAATPEAEEPILDAIRRKLAPVWTRVGVPMATSVWLVAGRARP